MTRSGRAALAGYSAGLATAAALMVVGLTPSPESRGEKGRVTVQPTVAAPGHPTLPLGDAARREIAPLEARLVADPGDEVVRKRLMAVLVQEQQLMEAYENASEILAADPEDPDALYVHGVVRLAMGQAPRAIELLDRVLARDPDHVRALEARAEAQRRIGDRRGAALTAAKAGRVSPVGADGGALPETGAPKGETIEMVRSSRAPSAKSLGGG